MKIAFFGLPLAAVLLARDGHTIAYAAACRRAPGLRRLATHVAPGRTWLRPNLTRGEGLIELREAAPDLLVSWFWTSRLPTAALALAPSVGIHPSLLPRHRGPDPYFWAIDSGDATAGVTAHHLDEDYDTGAILAQREIPVDAGWNAWQLARALDRPSLALLREVVSSIAEGRTPAARPQDHGLATQAPAPSDDDLAIRWSWSAERIERRVRAASPWPGAWTEIGDRIVTLVRVRPTAAVPRALAPAEATVRTDGTAVVRAADAGVELLEARDASDAPMSREDLARLVRAVRQA